MVSVLKVVRVVISPAAVGEDHGAAVAGDGRREVIERHVVRLVDGAEGSPARSAEGRRVQ
jgi:hypothetical protein